MSSPFRYFRKHTKAFMAVAAVLCMFIFVIGSSFSGNGPTGGGSGADATVATWNGGTITQQQLNAMIAHRLITDEFLKRLFAQGGGQSEYDLPLDIPVNGLLLSEQQRKNIEQVVIQTEIEADLAKEAGITVSDDLVSNYIEKLGLNNLNAEQIDQVLASVGNRNPRTSEGIVMGTLRKMLAAHLYTRMYADPARVVLPHQRWQDWKQVNERIALQVAVLPVDKFLTEVPEPTDEQLRALYNDFKDFDPGRRVDVGGRILANPDPGFAEPRRVRLQYLKGSVAELTEKVLDKVSDADIAYYYEQNKDANFLKMDAPSEPTPPAETAPETTAPPAAEPAATETPATETPATEPAASEMPATEAPAESTPAAPATPDAKAEQPAAESSSDARSASPFRLASFQETPAAEEAPAATEPAAEPAPPVEPPATTEAPAESPEAAPAAADAAPAATEATPPAAATVPAADKYEPLANVRDEIRRELARDLAMKELDRVMGESMAQLQTEFNTFGIALVEAEEAGKKQPKPPAKLADLQWLGDKNGLAFEKTSLLTMPELFDTPVGKAVGTATQQMTVTQAAFMALKPFEPFLASELEDVVYIVSKTEDVPRRIPEFKDVRDQVVTAWKQRAAAELAEKKAKELATEFPQGTAPFDQFFFADRGFKVIKETALFSWLNYPAGRAGYGSLPGLSDIPELKGIGPQFMEAAFKLKDSETIGLLNYDQTAAYVIRVARKQWSDDDLKRLFLEESESWLGGRDMLYKHASIFNSAIESDMFEQRAGLKFDEKWLEERQKRMER